MHPVIYKERMLLVQRTVGLALCGQFLSFLGEHAQFTQPSGQHPQDATQPRACGNASRTPSPHKAPAAVREGSRAAQQPRATPTPFQPLTRPHPDLLGCPL